MHEMLSGDGPPQTVTSSHPVTSVPACQWRTVHTQVASVGRSEFRAGGPGLDNPHGRTCQGKLDPAKVLPEAYHALPTPCAYICIHLPIPSAPRPPHPSPPPSGDGRGKLKRLEAYETMLDGTSPSGTCDLQKTAHHAHPASPVFRAKERFAQAPATCDWTLGVAFC